jgi:uncharacterized Zn-binding protein involved in type VI secretion
MSGAKSAARANDDAAHDGVVKEGSKDTMIGGQPAARYGDEVECKVHPDGRIGGGSTAVFVNGVALAREGDPVKCGGDHHAAVVYKEDGNDHTKLFYAEAKGREDGARAGFGFFSLSKMFQHAPFKAVRKYVQTFYGEHLGIATGEVGASAGKVDARANMFTVGGVTQWTPRGDTQHPISTTDYHADVLNADASAQMLPGYDGRRVGIGVALEGGATAIAAGSNEKVEAQLWEGSDYSLRVDWDEDVSAGSAEIGAGAMAFYDMAEKRFHLSGLARLGWGVGDRTKLDISIGKRAVTAKSPLDAPQKEDEDGGAKVKKGVSHTKVGG